MSIFSHGAELVPPPDQVDPVLDAHNMLGRAAYRECQAVAGQSLARIVIIDFYHITLIESSWSETVSITPPIYTILKDVGHGCIGVHAVILRHVQEGRLPALGDKLATFAEHLERSRESFQRLDVESSARTLGLEILASNEELLRHAIAGGSMEAEHLEAWGRVMGPRLERIFRLAAHAQVDAIHHAMTRWASSRGPSPWANLWVVPTAPAVAREGFLQTQYFTRLLGEEGARERLVFAENLAGLPEALQLLTKVVFDRSLSATIFGDPRRLEIDILAFGARERLDELFGPSLHAWSPPNRPGTDQKSTRRTP